LVFFSQGFFLLFAWSSRHQLLLSLLLLHVWISFSLCFCVAFDAVVKLEKSEVWTTFVCWAKGKLGFTIPCQCGCCGLWNKKVNVYLPPPSRTLETQIGFESILFFFFLFSFFSEKQKQAVIFLLPPFFF
jgi:hypothetical protein